MFNIAFMRWTDIYRTAHNNWCKRTAPGFYEASGGDRMLVTFPKVTSSNGLTKAIIYFLNWEGHHAERTNNMGRPVDKRTTYTDVVGRVKQIGSLEWQIGTGTKGTSDIKADLVHPAHRFPIPVKIEVKWAKDTQKDAQKDYQAAIESKGGVYVIVKNIDGFFEWYEEFMLTLYK